MEKGKINEGEYLVQCKYLKEEKELEELAKEITTFDVESLTEEEAGDFVPMAFEVPEEVLAMGIEAVQNYGRAIQQEARAMSRVRASLESLIEDEHGDEEQYTRHMASQILHNYVMEIKEIIEEAHGAMPDIPSQCWEQWLEENYNNCFARSSPNYQQQMLNAGFPRTYNAEICFMFDLHREPRRLTLRIYAVNDEEIRNVRIGVFIWNLGGEVEWGLISHQ
jgi:hypothetical protein